MSATPGERLSTAAKSAVLDLPMPENDANAATVRDYLAALLDDLCGCGEVIDGCPERGRLLADADPIEAGETL